MFEAALLNSGVLVTLKNSDRNWSRFPSLTLKFLWTDRFASFVPGPTAGTMKGCYSGKLRTIRTRRSKADWRADHCVRL